MKVSVLSMFTAVAIILSYIESFIPVIGIPGVRLGLANIAIVLLIYYMGVKEALLVNIVRILIIGVLFGNMFTIIYSIAGAAFSMIAMVILKKTGKMHIQSVSIAGGIAHNIGQLIIAAFTVTAYGVIYYAPVLMASGIVTGMFNGIIANIIYKRTRSYIVTRINKEV